MPDAGASHVPLFDACLCQCGVNHRPSRVHDALCTQTVAPCRSNRYKIPLWFRKITTGAIFTVGAAHDQRDHAELDPQRSYNFMDRLHVALRGFSFLHAPSATASW